MGVLSDFFGSESETSSLTVRRTSWPQAEEHLRSILDTFQELAGFEPHGFVRKQWLAGARDWYSVFGGDTDLLRDAVEKMRDRELVMSSPRSCISIATDLKRKNKKTDWHEVARQLEEWNSQEEE